MVRRAEQLADTLPDSTASLIDSVLRMPVYFSERHRMDMALLQAEALFDNHGQEISPLMDDDFFDDKPFLSTSPDLERAAAYYAGKKQYDKAARSALYSGFVQQHYSDKTTAMQSFKDAERYGGIIGDSLAVAQAEFKMGRMLFYDGLYQEALIILKKSERNFSNHIIEKALLQNMMAACYMVQKNYIDAEICLQQILMNSRIDKVKRKALNNYAVLYQLQGKYDQAIDCLKQNANNSNLNEKELLLINLNLGDAFFYEGKIDSAAFYYKNIDSLLPEANVKIETKASAYDALSRFAETQGDASKALMWREKHGEALFEVMNQRQEQNIYRIQQQYDYESLQNTMNQKLARTQRIIALGIVLLLSVVALFLRYSSQRNKREAEINANLFHFMQQNEELKRRHEEYSDMDLDKSQKMSDLLSDKFRTMQKLDYFMQNQGDKSTLRELERELFGGKNHLEALMELFDTMYPDLQATFKAKYPQATDLECKVYLLSRFRLPRVEEATLLGISTSVLDKVRGKVRKMMENG
jgi:tetratricopeptide (TPR) repeat protein